MSRFIFKHRSHPELFETAANQSIVHKTDAVSMDEILDSFTNFLRGCGFFVEGDLQDVKEDEIVVTMEEWNGMVALGDRMNDEEYTEEEDEEDCREELTVTDDYVDPYDGFKPCNCGNDDCPIKTEDVL